MSESSASVHPASAPIVLFDSGVGGLTVLAELRALLPQAPVIYAADIAGLPYGSKTEAEVAARYTSSQLSEEPARALAVPGCRVGIRSSSHQEARIVDLLLDL